MNRPTPVTVSAILLGPFAALKLIAALGMTFSGFLFLNKSIPTQTPAPFSTSTLAAIIFALALFFIALAVWDIVTMVGLFRMRYWARYSILTIAGFITFFAGAAMLSSIAMPFLAHHATTQPDLDPLNTIGFFWYIALFYAAFAAIGVAHLIYFNLAKTREIFQQYAPINLNPPNTSTGRPRPTAVTVISWIYLISGPICLLYVFLPFPSFFFGFVFYGLPAHLTYAAFGLLTFAVGYGLLRLYNSARIAVYAMFFLCPIQMLALLTPWGSRNFHLYMDAFNTKMYANQPPPPNFASSPGAIIFFTLIAMAGYGVILWLLHRHRAAFTPAPPAPPLPAEG
jgi:hypothetical protein